MPGLSRVFFGIFWIVAGFVLTGLSYAFPIFDQYAIFYGAWIFGGILVVWGLLEMAAWKLRGEGYRARRGAKIAVQTLVDTMCFVAHADGNAAEVEIAEIHKILSEDFGFQIELATVRERVSKHNYTYDDFLSEISMRSATIPPELKHEIVRAALIVAFADGYDKAEGKACGDLINNLGYLPPQTFELIKRIFPAPVESSSLATVSTPEPNDRRRSFATKFAWQIDEHLSQLDAANPTDDETARTRARLTHDLARADFARARLTHDLARADFAKFCASPSIDRVAMRERLANATVQFARFDVLATGNLSTNALEIFESDAAMQWLGLGERTFLGAPLEARFFSYYCKLRAHQEWCVASAWQVLRVFYEGPTDPDWYRPFVASQRALAEYQLAQFLGLESELWTPELGASSPEHYWRFVSLVSSGAGNPLQEWTDPYGESFSGALARAAIDPDVNKESFKKLLGTIKNVGLANQGVWHLSPAPAYDLEPSWMSE